jgi:8-hydroxy-5-deazaflavin:NADPH oxidoreductase
MKERIGVLGSGDVAKALAKGLKKHGKEVRIGSRSAEKLAQFAAEEALRLAGTEHLDGKIVIDTTNPIADAPPVDGVLQFFTGPGDSLMERLQKQVPGARFVKAFNSVGNAVMIDLKFPGGPPTMFFCGNDADAKRAVASRLKEIGWDPADMGSAVAARAIEPLCQLWCIPGFREQQWRHAFKLLR